jgi:hypothetical protein
MSEDDKQQGGGNGKPAKPYKILIDHKPHEWPNAVITGADIKQLAGVDQNAFEAWQDVPGPEDLLIGNADEVDLTKPGNEKFFVIKKSTTEG